MRTHGEGREEVFINPPWQVVLAVVEALAEQVGAEVGVGILHAGQVGDALGGELEEIVDREVDPRQRWDIVVVERQRWRGGGHLSAASDEVFDVTRLEVGRRNHRDGAGLIALRLGGERRGISEAVGADMNDDVDAARPGHGRPAVAEGEALGELKGDAFAGRAADEDAVDLAGKQVFGLAFDHREVQRPIGVEGRVGGGTEPVELESGHQKGVSDARRR